MQWQSDQNSICISTFVTTPLILILQMFFYSFQTLSCQICYRKNHFLVPPFNSSDVKHPVDKAHTFAPCLRTEREKHANHLFSLLNPAGSSNMAYGRTQKHQKCGWIQSWTMGLGLEDNMEMCTLPGSSRVSSQDKLQTLILPPYPPPPHF